MEPPRRMAQDTGWHRRVCVLWETACIVPAILSDPLMAVEEVDRGCGPFSYSGT
jgi:hypothetical protein